MLNKKSLNKLKLGFGMLLCAIAVLASPCAALTTYAAGGDVEVCQEFREWVYKIEDGKLYKALYNGSTGLLETDWIYVCDWPPEE